MTDRAEQVARVMYDAMQGYYVSRGAPPKPFEDTAPEQQHVMLHAAQALINAGYIIKESAPRIERRADGRPKLVALEGGA